MQAQQTSQSFMVQAASALINSAVDCPKNDLPVARINIEHAIVCLVVGQVESI